MMHALGDHRETLTRQRHTFARNMAGLPTETVVRAIRADCLAGLGDWIEPSTASTSTRPATHLFEISFLGQTAVGFTAEQAADNWRTIVLAEADAGEAR